MLLGRERAGELPLCGSVLRFPSHGQEQLLSALTFLHFLELNDREENENHFPIIYGIGK